MLQVNLDEVSLNVLQRLCDEKTPESPTLEFKRILPPATPEGRQELMKDACALANGEGGDIIYGIGEKAGAAAALLPMAGLLADPTQRWMRQTLDSVEPRINGVKVHPISDGSGLFIVLRVPASFDGPHSFQVANAGRRFVLRNGSGTTDMNIDQIRTAFDRSATIAERARDFIQGRQRRLGHRMTWKQFHPGPIAAVHWVPIAGLKARATVDIAALNNQFADLAFGNWGGISRTMNLDGLVVFPGAPDPQLAYVQVFRNGAIEYLQTGASLRSDSKTIPSLGITKFYREAVHKCAQLSRRLGQAGPCVVQCALMHVDDYEFVAGAPEDRSSTRSDRSHVVLPDIWIEAIEDLKTAEQIDQIVRPMMDILWQAFDLERCFAYELNGTWSAR